MDSRRYFARRRILVTGGSSGIGLAFARQAVRLGADAVLVARRPAMLAAARDALRRERAGADVEVVALDVADAAAVADRVGAVLAAAPVDMLVNSAGTLMPARFLDLSLAQFREMIDVNVLGVVNLCKVVVPHLVARRTGHVLNVASLGGVVGIYGYTAYAASKFAVVGFSQALRAELWPHGVRVSVALPPDTDTPMLAFEEQHRPAETRAIAGSVKTLSADRVAAAMIAGMARAEFEIYCDVASRLLARTQGVVPGVVRWFSDRAQRRADGSSTRPA